MGGGQVRGVGHHIMEIAIDQLNLCCDTCAVTPRETNTWAEAELAAKFSTPGRPPINTSFRPNPKKFGIGNLASEGSPGFDSLKAPRADPTSPQAPLTLTCTRCMPCLETKRTRGPSQTGLAGWLVGCGGLAAWGLVSRLRIPLRARARLRSSS